MSGAGWRERWPALAHGSFRYYWAARFLSRFTVQIVSVAVGWQVYDTTRDPLDLGLIGLVQFLPSLLLVLVTGVAADRFGRRTIMAVSLLAQGACAVALLILSIGGLGAMAPVFLVLACFGVARAFFNPASSSLVANLVPEHELAGAIALNSASGQIATICGPVAGGLLYGLSAEAAYGTAISLFALASLAILRVERPVQKNTREPVHLTTVLAGFRYVWSEKVVLGAVSLDLFAVLLGGAVALLPVYARDILELGPWGLGLLRAGPGIGALLVGVYLTTSPIRDHAGSILLVFVGGFGLFTTIFGLSTVAWLSILCLVAIGACDMVSVFVRETLVQLWTPDALRGRVNAVNMVFIGASNELGEFRAGVTAALIGTVGAVVAGGIGTMAVAALWVRLFPELRATRHLHGRH